jgi:hypothetical protein
VDERPVERNQAVLREYEWIPAATLSKLRVVVRSYLDGRRDVDADIDQLASKLATAAHDAGCPSERMVISLRGIWRDFTFTQLDRLQLASLYDRLVRQAITRYYAD